MRCVLFITLTTLLLAGCAATSPQDEQFAKEQTACAQLGLTPGSEIFSSCVTDLDVTMFDLSDVGSKI